LKRVNDEKKNPQIWLSKRNNNCNSWK
jgi:hypothetical protein